MLQVCQGVRWVLSLIILFLIYEFSLIFLFHFVFIAFSLFQIQNLCIVLFLSYAFCSSYFYTPLFLVCRADQVKTSCACPVTCDDKVNTKCTSQNCKEGCVCPKGKYDNGTHCIDVTGCYCKENNGRVRKVSVTRNSSRK